MDDINLGGIVQFFVEIYDQNASNLFILVLQILR